MNNAQYRLADALISAITDAIAQSRFDLVEQLLLHTADGPIRRNVANVLHDIFSKEAERRQLSKQNVMEVPA